MNFCSPSGRMNYTVRRVTYPMWRALSVVVEIELWWDLSHCYDVWHNGLETSALIAEMNFQPVRGRIATAQDGILSPSTLMKQTGWSSWLSVDDNF